MRLFIMRHGPAEADSASGRDADRALSNHGRERTAAVARELERRGETFERIQVSPLRRALETAEIVRGIVAKGPPLEVRSELSPSEDARVLVQEAVRSATGSLLLVGHSPDVAILAGAVLGEHVASFDTAAVVAIDMDAGRAIRRYTLAPHLLQP